MVKTFGRATMMQLIDRAHEGGHPANAIVAIDS
jgi:hypothetical protein